MQFHSHEAIYLQIADYISEKILKKEWLDDARIPAVREMAIDVQVNPNTVVRTYAYLEENGIIYKQRGIGYFIAKGACKKALELIKKDFLQHDVPAFLKKMELLGIAFDEIKSQGTGAEESTNAPPSRGLPPQAGVLATGSRKLILDTAIKSRYDDVEDTAIKSRYDDVEDTAIKQQNDAIDFEQATSSDFSAPKKQAISVENKRVSLPPLEKVTFVEDKMEAMIDASPDLSSDKSMSWD